MKDIDSAVRVWKAYIDTIHDWRSLTVGVVPKPTGCGPIYELLNPIDRPNESFAIADMRDIKIAEPHYHTNGETEVYVVLQGSGLVVVGGKEQQIETGSTVITPPNTAHFTIPAKDLVLAVINLPPFKPENYIVLSATNHNVGFDQEQYARLSPQAV